MTVAFLSGIYVGKADVISPVFITATVALYIYLGVRVINRRERWAKRTLAAMIGVPVLYIASFGPVCWLGHRGFLSGGMIEVAYRPIAIVLRSGPPPVRKALRWYAGFTGTQTSMVELEIIAP